MNLPDSAAGIVYLSGTMFCVMCFVFCGSVCDKISKSRYNIDVISIHIIPVFQSLLTEGRRIYGIVYVGRMRKYKTA